MRRVGRTVPAPQRIVAGGGAALAGLAALLALAGPAAAQPAPPAAIEAAWVQLVPADPSCTEAPCPALASLRIVVPSATGAASPCPAALAREAAQAGAPIALRPRPNQRPQDFPISVCEARLPLDHPGAILADGTTLRWPALAGGAAPRAIAVLGDTGCDDGAEDVALRSRRPDDPRRQDCADAAAWPLAAVAARAAASGNAGAAPDLVVHVGDYRYQGLDTWAAWKADVLDPMRPLLRAAPWVMVRGNHENCWNPAPAVVKGQGWALLLSPLAPEAEPGCAWDRDGGFRMDPPHALDLGPLRLVVLDSADAKYRCDRWPGAFAARDAARLRRMLRAPVQATSAAAAQREVWLLTHYVVFDALVPAREQVCDPAAAPRPGFSPLAYSALLAKAVADAGVRTVLSGDVHAARTAQVVALWEPPPPVIVQHVAGDGGVRLGPLPEAAGCDAATAPRTCRAAFAPAMPVAAGGDAPPDAPRYGVETQVWRSFGFLTAAPQSAGGGWRFDRREVAPAPPP